MVVFDSIIYGLQRFGGISNYWEHLTSHAINNALFDSTLLLPRKILGKAFSQDRVQGAAIVREALPAWLSRYLTAQVKGAEILHTSYYRLPRYAVKKYVVTVYDFIYERYRTGLAREVHKKQKADSIRRADEIICISDYTRQDVFQFYPDIDPERVHVVPLAVDHSCYFPEVPAGHEEKNEILFVGQRGGYKRFDLAVEAARQSPDLKLAVVGPFLTPLEQSYLKKMLGERWTYYGSVSVAELRKLYSRAFCFIFPSDYEGFGLPILEAMACGCPVVSSSSASLPEVGGAAALFAARQSAESYSQAFETLRNSWTRNKYVELGFAHSKEFTWERTFDLTFNIYIQSGL